MAGLVKLKEIRRMLKECAPNHIWEEKLHHIWITYNGRTFKNFPKGEHGGKDEIERGWVNKLARFFEIVECAKGLIPNL